jgi:hypothetical protein
MGPSLRTHSPVVSSPTSSRRAWVGDLRAILGLLTGSHSAHHLPPACATVFLWVSLSVSVS